MIALETVSHDPRGRRAGRRRRAAVGRLWDVCQIPDYRKISAQNHAELVATLYKFLMAPEERIPEDWFAKQVALADRTDGDIDTLANRIAHIRTWTFVSNRVDWLADHEHWQERTRAIEDSLSDALHEQLTQRFVDRRTSALMRGLKEKDELYAEIADDGAVHVEKHFVGRLQGFRFFPDAQAEGIHGKATRNAAAHVLAKELAMRVRRVVAAKADAFKLDRSGQVLWRDEEIARLEAGDDPLKPSVVVLADEHLPGPDKEKVQERLNAWLTETDRRAAEAAGRDRRMPRTSPGLARGIAFRLKENFGVLRRESVAEEIRSLDQPARAQLRKYGVRFGAFNIYFPAMLKPACSELAVVLWTLEARRDARPRHRRHARAAAAGAHLAAGSGRHPARILSRDGLIRRSARHHRPARRAGSEVCRIRYVVSWVRISLLASTCCQVMLPANHELAQDEELLESSGLFLDLVAVDLGRRRNRAHDTHRGAASGPSCRCLRSSIQAAVRKKDLLLDEKSRSNQSLLRLSPRSRPRRLRHKSVSPLCASLYANIVSAVTRCSQPMNCKLSPLPTCTAKSRPKIWKVSPQRDNAALFPTRLCHVWRYSPRSGRDRGRHPDAHH